MVMVTIVVAVVLAPTMVIPVPVTANVSAIAMTFLVTRCVLMLVPVVLHKVDPLATGVIFAAVFAPIFLMARADVQIARPSWH